MSVEMMPLVLILQQLLLLVSYTAQPSECTDMGCIGEKGEPVDCSIVATLSCQCDLCTVQGIPSVPGPPGRQVSGLFSSVLLESSGGACTCRICQTLDIQWMVFV